MSDHERWSLPAEIGVRTLTVPGLFSPMGDPCTYPPAKSSTRRTVSMISTRSRGCWYVDSFSAEGRVVTVNE